MKTQKELGANNIAPQTNDLSTGTDRDIKVEGFKYETIEMDKRGIVRLFWNRLGYISVDGERVPAITPLLPLPEESYEETKLRREALVNESRERCAKRAATKRAVKKLRKQNDNDNVRELLKHLGKLGLL